MPSWDEITDQLNAATVAVFGQADPAAPALVPVYIPVIGAPFALNGVFDNGVGIVDLNDPTSEIWTPKPMLGCASADFPAPPVADDHVFIPKVNATYVVKAVADDSHGGVQLELLVSVRHGPGYTVPGYAP